MLNDRNIHLSSHLNKDNKIRIAVLLPVKYSGGTLRGAQILARAIDMGAREDGKSVEIIFGYAKDPSDTIELELLDLPSHIKIRPFQWQILDKNRASIAMQFAGKSSELKQRIYQAPDDGINYFMDCDLLVFISDRLVHPLLPIKPYILMVFDHIQRRAPVISKKSSAQYIRAAHDAKKVFVTTNFALNDGLQYAGLSSDKIKKIPLIAPKFSQKSCGINLKKETDSSYFLWGTNLSLHKNHLNSLLALKIYYEEYEGKLNCYVTGYATDLMLNNDMTHLKPAKEIYEASHLLKEKLKLLGELSDSAYQSILSEATFYWHTAYVDNGTFSVIEAAQLGISSLSSDYPPMHEINEQYQLNLTWMNPFKPRDMAGKLKKMELESHHLRNKLPPQETLAQESIEKYALAYWKAIEECL